MSRLRRCIFMLGKYTIGLDIGIGSVGWAVINQDNDKARLEDFGVRLFDSGELNGGKDRLSQKRRQYRSERRLIRRRKHRRERLKSFLQLIGLTTWDKIQAWYESNDPNIYAVRSKGVYERLSGEEIAVSLIHIANHRGYRDFYEFEDDDLNNIKRAISVIDEIFTKGNYKTIGEMFYKDDEFYRDYSGNVPSNKFKYFPHTRNSDKEYRYLVNRKYLKHEVATLLNIQSQFHSCLTQQAKDKIIKIIFSQRDFEDGPGNKDDETRRYKGFLHSIGNCRYYKNLQREFRHTVLGDIFSLTNALSQYTYRDTISGKINLSPVAAKAIIFYAMTNASISVKEIKKILKEYHIELIEKEGIDKNAISKCLKYLPYIRKSLEESGYIWTDFISEEQFDKNNASKLHTLGRTLSSYQTPKRREKELRKLDFVNNKLINQLAGKKFSGTSQVSKEFMIDAIMAFMQGETYGNFQARKITDNETITNNYSEKNLNTLLPPISDKDITINPVVYRAINETRKIVNAIIRQYGSPTYINVEVAKELDRSFENREAMKKEQKKNEAKYDRLRDQCKKLFDTDKVSEVMLDKFQLYELQGGKCYYSGKPIKLDNLMSSMYEIDHIVPYSLILDNTLDNKALVLATENQNKRQQTPLMYLNNEQKAAFLARVNEDHRQKKISDKKYRYLTLKNLDDEELLNEWKSRNIHDTRYITKYITNYFQRNLKFNSNKKHTVYAIKSAVTSRFRKLWLRGTIWGAKEKDRQASYLHHAVDAIVVANLTPEYIEIASDYLKLDSIYRKNNKIETSEYLEYFETCLEKMHKYYGFNREYATKLLKGGKVPALLPQIQAEISIRLNEECTPDEYFDRVTSFYEDYDFAAKLRQPIVSQKAYRKYKGQINDSNPISVREIGGELWKIKRVAIEEINIKDLDKLVGVSADLMDSLKEIFSGKQDEYTIGQYLKENNIKIFKDVSDRPVRKLSIKEAPTIPKFIKEIDNDNASVLNTKYYCVELYRDSKNNLCMHGIHFVDIKKINGKLMLNKNLPEDYKSHVMYLNYNDYIRIVNKKGQLKALGYYQGVANINKCRIYCSPPNKPELNRDKLKVSISKGDTVSKFDITLLGKLGGEVKCGEPFLSVKVND